MNRVQTSVSANSVSYMQFIIRSYTDKIMVSTRTFNGVMKLFK
jgi:hypothetical protein